MSRVDRMSRSKMLAMVATVAILIGALALLALGPTRGSSTARLGSDLKEAILADEGSTSLPPGFAIGHASDTARAALRTGIISLYEKYFAGAQLTRDINASLAWADRMSTQDGGGGAVTDLHLDSYSMDPVFSVGLMATASGNYSMTEGINDSLPDRSISHRRIWVAYTFTAQLQYLDGRWKVSDLSTIQTDFRGLEPTSGPVSSPVQGAPKASHDPQSEPILPQHQPTQP
ncbi:MAG: hypothetical protein ACRDGL_06365 [Candidatus Limnocylindrales bacterium]